MSMGLMSMRRVAVLLAGLLLAGVCANAAVVKGTIRITVLESVTRGMTADDNNGVPNNCEQLTFDAYCRSSASVPMVSTLLVQAGDEPPFRITCKIDTRYSRCTPLPKGETFDARREKHGITVYYVDDKGKARKQLYSVVGEQPNAAPVAAVAVAQTAPAASPVQSAAPAQAAPSQASSPQAAPPARHALVPAAAPPVAAAPATVRCSFSSTPAGAEITLDGRYVGSTPSALNLTAGAHAVVISLPGFGQWKRDLTVEPGSELTVNAVLEKAQ
jgi:hypothetical protein